MISEARSVSTKKIIKDTEKMGADAIIATRFGSSSIMKESAEIIAYRNAVKLKLKTSSSQRTFFYH